MVSAPAKVKDKNQIVSIRRTNLVKTKVIHLAAKHDESSIDEEGKLKADI